MLLVLASCRPPAPKIPPEGTYLTEIRIEGTKAIDVDDIAPGLAIDRARRGTQLRAVDAYLLTVDIERVRAAYLKIGFFNVKVTARVDLEGREQTVVFVVVEGKRSTATVEITGLPPEIPLAKARALVAIRDGEPFDYLKYDLAKLPMVKLVEDAGYANVDVEAVVLADRAASTATVRFAITPGELARFGKVVIEGADGLDDAVRGRLLFAEGDIYSQTAIQNSQRELYDLNRFSTVRIEPDRTSPTSIAIKVTVVRLKGGEWRAGFGAGRDVLAYELRARLGVTIVPHDIPLWAFSADFRPAVTWAGDVDKPELKFRVTTSAARSELFRPRMIGELEASYDYLNLEGYLTQGPRFRAGLSSPLGHKWLTGRVGWLIEREDFSDVKIAEPVAMAIGLDGTQRRGAFELQLAADLRDNPLDVRKGLYATFRAVYGTPYAGGDGKPYTQLSPELRGYYPLGPFVFALRGSLGLLIGDVPVTERFFSGGYTSNRGYGDRELSPRAPGTTAGDTVRIGGVGLLETSAELRVPLTDHIPFTTVALPLGTMLFVDAGDVVTDLDKLDPFDQHVAVGVGIYFKVAGIKIGGDLAKRVYRADAGDATGFFAGTAWHIVVGDAF